MFVEAAAHNTSVCGLLTSSTTAYAFWFAYSSTIFIILAPRSCMMRLCSCSRSSFMSCPLRFSSLVPAPISFCSRSLASSLMVALPLRNCSCSASVSERFLSSSVFFGLNFACTLAAAFVPSLVFKMADWILMIAILVGAGPHQDCDHQYPVRHLEHQGWDEGRCQRAGKVQSEEDGTG